MNEAQSQQPAENAGTLGQHLVFRVKYVLVLVWGFFCTLVFVPPAILLWGNTSLSWAYARTLSWVALKILGIRLEITGRENLAGRPAIVIANHQSNYDVIIMGAIYPRHTVVIGKKELRRLPLFGIFFAATGSIMIDRTNRQGSVAGLDQAVDALRRRRTSIWIFPEGQRSRGSGLSPFKKGAFHMAIAAGVPIIPIVCSSTDRVVNARTKIAPGGVVRMHVLEPVPTTGLQPSDVEGLKDRMEATFNAEWNRLEASMRN